jgi:hypothetical protein
VVGSSALPALEGTLNPTWFWRRAHMVNVDASLERDVRFAIVRPFAGIGYILNGGDAVAVNQPCVACAAGVGARVIPYVGVAIAFGVL